MTRTSASAALHAHTHSLTHPFTHSPIRERGRMGVKMRHNVSVCVRETLMDGSGDGEIELSETNQSRDIKRQREIWSRFSIG